MRAAIELDATIPAELASPAAAAFRDRWAEGDREHRMLAIEAGVDDPEAVDDGALLVAVAGFAAGFATAGVVLALLTVVAVGRVRSYEAVDVDETPVPRA